MMPAPDEAAEPATWGLHEDGQGERGRVLATATLPLDPFVWANLAALARRHALTPDALAWAGFALLLGRLAGGAVALWTWSPGPNTDDGTLVGLAMDVDAEPDFTEAARTAMRRLLALAAEPASTGPPPGAPAYAFAVAPDAQATRRPHGREAAAWQLVLLLRPSRGATPGVMRLDHDPACFSGERAGALLEAYARVLTWIASATRPAIADLTLATAHHRAPEWPRQPPADPCALADRPDNLAGLFDAIVARWPAAAAVAWPGGRSSFAALSADADTVAAALRANGARAGDIVAFRLTADAPARDRVLYLASQIAAFRLGCAVLPLGQQQQAVQARAQIEAVGAGFLIDPSAAFDCAPPWAVAAGRRPIAGGAAAVLAASGAGRRLDGETALVLTTSGTTGLPKAIRLGHAMLLGLLRGVIDSGTIPGLPALLGANIAFDMAFADAWLAWTFGRHVVVLETERRTPAMIAHAQRLGARVISLSPTVAAAALRDDPRCFDGFHTLALVGEVLPRTLLRRLAAAAPALSVVNAYGPSETAILCNVSRTVAGEDGGVPIGRALRGYTVLIADPATGAALPPHWPGELLIASAAPALGYLDAATTAKAFVAVAGATHGPFFRSGDLGWVGVDGQVRLLGRRDRQCKIGGVRVELNGVEHVIAQVPGVDVAAAIVTGVDGAARVIAVVRPAAIVADQAALRASILAHCRAWLPRAAVPARVEFVAALPTGASGKTSHETLLRLVGETAPPPEARGGVPESGSIEATLAAMWAERLALATAPRRDDDVFALGATSLDAIIMAEHIERTFGLRFPDDQMFLRPSVASQAAFVRAARPATLASPAVIRRRVEFRLARPASGGAMARGVVLGMPELGGGAFYTGLIAANALADFDIWTCTADIGQRRLNEDDLWLEVAQAAFDGMVRGEAPRPCALLGFSIAAYVGWLVERMLADHGRDVGPLLSLDGGPVHLYYAGWSERVAALLPPAGRAPPPRMLLLHRPHRSWYDKHFALADDWTSLGVAVSAATLRSVRHLDAGRPAVIDRMRHSLNAFASGAPGSAEIPTGIELPTPGCQMVALLEAAAPPRPAAVRALLDSLPAGAVDFELRVPLLFLATCSGDGELALGVARRLSAEDPPFRPAVYGEVAIQVARGRRDLAMARADAWLRDHAGDADMRARAERNLDPVSWQRGPVRARSPEEGLDFAAGLLATTH